MVVVDGRAGARPLRPLGPPDLRERRRRRRARLPEAARPAAPGDHERHAAADVVSVSYGVCESTVSAVHRVAHAGGAPARGRRPRSASPSVVAAGDTRLVGLRARRPRRASSPSPTSSRRSSWPASSPWVLAVGGTNLTLNAAERDRVDRGVERHDLPVAVHGDGRRRGRAEHVQGAAVVAAGAVVREHRDAHGPRRRRVRRREPRLPDRLLGGVQGCPARPDISFVGGTSAATPLVAGMIALWDQQAKARACRGPASCRRCSTRWRSSAAAFLDVALGTNALFGGSCCPARTGLRPGDRLGSPLANVVAGLLGSAPPGAVAPGRRDWEAWRSGKSPREQGAADGILSETRVLIVANRTAATPRLLEAVRRRAREHHASSRC